MERFKNIIPFVAALCILILAGNVVLKRFTRLIYRRNQGTCVRL